MKAPVGWKTKNQLLVEIMTVMEQWSSLISNACYFPQQSPRGFLTVSLFPCCQHLRSGFSHHQPLATWIQKIVTDVIYIVRLYERA